MARGRWTAQQVLALAPDAASVKAARGLAARRTWSDLGTTASLVYGKCQGTGKQPYQVTVDLTEPAFRCTCPSRKQPCKHGLALLLLWAEHGDAVAEAVEAPAFAREGAPAPSPSRRPRPEVVDPEAQARRQAEREVAMTAGLDELERWLGDLVRQGLAGARSRPYAFWDAMAARLVDAQLPGLAERVRQVGGSLLVRPDWADVLFVEAGRWELAVQAWRRRDVLPSTTVGDLRAFVGWPRRPDEAAAFERMRDRWIVAGAAQGDDGRIVSQRTWFFGERTGRWVVLLDFAAAGAALRVPAVVGAVVDDELVLHPGSEPARAALSGRQRVVALGAVPPGTTVDAALDRLAGWLAANPWVDRLPVAVDGVVPVADGGRWWLQDAAGHRLPLSTTNPWPVLALSGGSPVAVMGEWADGGLEPLTVTAAGAPVGL